MLITPPGFRWWRTTPETCSNESRQSTEKLHLMISSTRSIRGQNNTPARYADGKRAGRVSCGEVVATDHARLAVDCRRVFARAPVSAITDSLAPSRSVVI